MNGHTYTAEDFKNARFAEHPGGAEAVRWEMNYRVPWHTVIGDRFSDEQMAENGWRPVREHNPHATDALAYEQRTIALIEYAKVADDETADRLWVDHIAPRLGLDGDES